MNFYKRIVENDKYELVLENDNGQSMKMHYGGADFYWTMTDYEDDNNFKVTEDDGELFLDLNKLFVLGKKKDPNFVSDTIEWVSEAREPEVCSKVVIKKSDDSIDIRFVRNPEDIFGMMARGCFISFCMSGSSHQEVAYLFSDIFIKYRSLVVEDDKKLIK